MARLTRKPILKQGNAELQREVALAIAEVLG
jgi:hypothetical protein